MAHGISRESATGPGAGGDGSGRGEQPALGQLFAQASRDLSTLVRDEVELAKLELRDDVKAAAVGGGMFGAAAFLGLMAVILLSFALVYLLVTLGLNTALSFLIVALLYLLVAGVLAVIGRRKAKQVRPPERTIATTKESVAVLKGGSAALPAGRR